MGKDFYEAFVLARQVFECASDALGLDLARLCFGDDGRLDLTEFAQPAILTTEVSMLRSIESEFGVKVHAWGGHSLGEYTALVASGTVGLEAAVRVVRQRGRLMQRAVGVGLGGMMAVIGDSIDREKLTGCLEGLRVELANDNAVGQVVMSGLGEHLLQAKDRIQKDRSVGAHRMVPLDVSAPFHSALMKPIEGPFREVLQENMSGIRDHSATHVTCNVSGGVHEGDGPSILDRLVEQVSSTVRWRDNMKVLAGRCSTMLEVGPRRPLRGFFKSMGVAAHAVTSLRSARRVLSQEAMA